MILYRKQKFKYYKPPTLSTLLPFIVEFISTKISIVDIISIVNGFIWYFLNFVILYKSEVDVMSIIDKICDLMNYKKITQKQLTDYLGLDKSTFSQWKSGKNQSYLKYISQIADFLNVPEYYLKKWRLET